MGSGSLHTATGLQNVQLHWRLLAAPQTGRLRGPSASHSSASVSTKANEHTCPRENLHTSAPSSTLYSESRSQPSFHQQIKCGVYRRWDVRLTQLQLEGGAGSEPRLSKIRLDTERQISSGAFYMKFPNTGKSLEAERRLVASDPELGRRALRIRTDQGRPFPFQGDDNVLKSTEEGGLGSIAQ